MKTPYLNLTRGRRQKLTVALISKEQIYEQENIHTRKCNRGRCVHNRIGNRDLHQPDMGCSDRGVNRNRQHCGGVISRLSWKVRYKQASRAFAGFLTGTLYAYSISIIKQWTLGA